MSRRQVFFCRMRKGEFWKIKAPACFLDRPSAAANANTDVVEELK